MSDFRNKNVFSFVLSEKFLTLTVIGSIFTFAFISSLKCDIIDPFLQFSLSEDFFGYMNITIRDGEEVIPPPRKIQVKLGNFFRELITWLLLMSILYVISKYTRFPDQPEGNITGAAIL